MSNSQASSTPIEIDVQSVKSLMDSETEFLLLDCREVSEHEHCRIEGSQLIPMNETPDRVAEIEAHSSKPIVVHCHHGGRSMQVVNWLRANGFPQAQNMVGGIEAWSCEVDPSVPRY
jgi:rhodanese-related sulfurtransferase